MTKFYDPVPIVNALNQNYVACVAELCRQDPLMARILLHMNEENVAAFGRFRLSCITRVNAIPIALTRPHVCALHMLKARSVADIYAPTQAAVERVLGEIR
jgi:hypothetical protein